MAQSPGLAELGRAETHVDVYGHDYAREPKGNTGRATPRKSAKHRKLPDMVPLCVGVRGLFRSMQGACISASLSVWKRTVPLALFFVL